MKNITSFSKTSPRLLIGVIMTSLLVIGVPFFASADTLTRQLEFGMSGSDVTALQTFLAQDNTIYPQGLVTGYFGPLTQSAVSNFQSRNGIDTVGRVGPITLAALNIQMDNCSVGFDKSAPMIGPLNVNFTNTTVAINWTTNENASAILYYSTSPLSMSEAGPNTGVTISGSSLLVHTDLRSSHSASLTGLQPNTTYFYVVYVRDGAGNESITWPSTFRTNQ